MHTRRVRVDFGIEIHTDRDRDDGFVACVDENTGFITLDGRLTRTGVFDYRDADGNEWGELRRPDEVFDETALDSFKQVVVTNDHPEQFVDVGNVNDVQVGHVGTDVRRDGDFVRATVTITDAKTVIAILAGKKELSCGYTAELIDEKGVIDGKRYDAIQINIRGNHLAIVDVGRAGPDCALITRSDGAAFTKGCPMATKKSDKKAGANGAPAADKGGLFAGVEALIEQCRTDAASRNDNAAEVAQGVMELLQTALKTGNEMIIKGALLSAGEMLSSPEPAPEPEPAEEEPPAEGDELLETDADEEEEMDQKDEIPPSIAPQDNKDSGDVVKMRARIDALEAARKRDAKSEAARIDARVELVSQVREICPDINPTGKTDGALKRAVVLAVSPELKDRLDANRKSPGYLQAAYDAALDLHKSREEHIDNAAHLSFDAANAGDDNDPDAAYADYIARRDARSNTRKAG